MTIYVLLFWMAGSGGVASAEFNSRSDCLTALEKITDKYRRMDGVCVPKGERK